MIPIHLSLTSIPLVRNFFYAWNCFCFTIHAIYINRTTFPSVYSNMQISLWMTDFEIDMNGKRYAWQVCLTSCWVFCRAYIVSLHLRSSLNQIFEICVVIMFFLVQGVAKLTFIDEVHLLAEISKVEGTLTVLVLLLFHYCAVK